MDLPAAPPEEEKRPERLKAIALAFDPDKDSAPRVVAMGQGEVAEKILAIGKEFNIPVKEDKLLTQALSKVDLDQEIPPELYAVVAEVLAFVYRIKEEKEKKII